MSSVDEAMAAVERLRKQKSVTARDVLPVLEVLIAEVLRLRERLDMDGVP